MRRYRKTAVYSDNGRRLGASILEVADTPDRRRTGLMWRKELPWVCGMLFDGLPGVGHFWMKNCFVDLDLILLGDGDEITRVYSMPADDGKGRYEYSGETRAIEVPMGFCEKHGIKKGCKVAIKDIGGSNG